MKKLLLGVLLFFSINTYAAYLKDVPQTLVQPDGSILKCYATGDEFYSWLHDENNYTIIQDPTTGYYVYANLIDGKLKPTTFVAGKINPETTNLAKGLNVSSTEMEQIRRASVLNQDRSYKKKKAALRTANTGSLNNVVVFIRFSDETEFNEPISKYDNLFNGSTANPSSVKRYFEECSYQQLSIQSTFYMQSNNYVVSYRDTHPRSYYSVYNSSTNTGGYNGESERTSREQKLLKDAIDYVSSQIPSDIDIDNDDDGYVDNVAFVVKGSAQGWSELLWPHRWALYAENAYINGIRVWDFNFLLQNSIQVGVLCHEMFHTLGAPDLYHYSQDGLQTVGTWDIMESNLNPPQSMGAYMKYQYGSWINSIPEITSSGRYTLNPVTSSTNNCYKIAAANHPDEFFVLEYRKKEGVFESGIPSTGLLIYRITTKDGSGNILRGNADGPPDEVYLYRPGGNSSSNGNTSNAHFAADVNRKKFNNNTDPACFLLDQSLGGIDVFNISETGSTISFNVNIGSTLHADFKSSTQNATPNSSISFSDESLGNPNSWTWSFTGGNPATSTSKNPTVTYTSYGTYAVKLKVKNSSGSDSLTRLSYINISPLNVEVGSDRSIVCGSTVKLQPHTYYTSDTNTLSYQWTPTQGLSNPNIRNPIASPTVNTTYKLHVSNGSYHAYDSITITSTPLSAVPVMTKSAIECGDSLYVTLTTNIPTGSFIRANGTIIDKYNIGIANFGPSVLQSFVNGPALYVKDGANSYIGCSNYAANTFKNKIAVIDRGTCNFSLKAYNAQLAGAKGVVVVNNVAGGSVLAMGAGDYGDLVNIPAVMISYEDGIALKSMIQAGTTKIVFGYDCDTVFYNWSPLNSVKYDNVLNNIVFPKETTNYSVSVGNNSCLQTINFQINVNKPTPIINQSHDTLYSNYPSGNQWYNDLGPIQGANGSYYVPQASAKYYCLHTESNGCVSDTSNKIDYIFTSISQENSGLIKVFPNPVDRSVLNIQSEKMIKSILIFDNNGVELFKDENIGSKVKVLNLSGLKNGTYLLRIIQEDSIIHQRITVLNN